jgi:hypothetical protein
MRTPLPASAPEKDPSYDAVGAALNDLLAADHSWLDALEPFAIEWELIWPM